MDEAHHRQLGGKCDEGEVGSKGKQLSPEPSAHPRGWYLVPPGFRFISFRLGCWDHRQMWKNKHSLSQWNSIRSQKKGILALAHVRPLRTQAKSPEDKNGVMILR